MYVESSDGKMFDYAILQSMVFPKIPDQYQARDNDTTGKCKVQLLMLIYINIYYEIFHGLKNDLYLIIIEDLFQSLLQAQIVGAR